MHKWKAKAERRRKLLEAAQELIDALRAERDALKMELGNERVARRLAQVA